MLICRIVSVAVADSISCELVSDNDELLEKKAVEVEEEIQREQLNATAGPAPKRKSKKVAQPGAATVRQIDVATGVRPSIPDNLSTAHRSAQQATKTAKSSLQQAQLIREHEVLSSVRKELFRPESGDYLGFYFLKLFHCYCQVICNMPSFSFVAAGFMRSVPENDPQTDSSGSSDEDMETDEDSPEIDSKCNCDSCRFVIKFGLYFITFVFFNVLLSQKSEICFLFASRFPGVR